MKHGRSQSFPGSMAASFGAADRLGPKTGQGGEKLRWGVFSRGVLPPSLPGLARRPAKEGPVHQCERGQKNCKKRFGGWNSRMALGEKRGRGAGGGLALSCMICLRTVRSVGGARDRVGKA